MPDTAEPIVSVVLPTYNRAYYVGEAIASVLGQTYDNYEIIVVDDGSTDDTKQVVGEISDSRLRYIHQENRGISGARNTGIRAATGHYIAFLDSDDCWLPTLLQTEVPLLDEDPATGLVYAQAQALDSTGNLLPQTTGAPPKFPDDLLKSTLWGDFVTTITVVVRRELLQQAGPFDETMKGNVDWDMWIRLSATSRFQFVNSVLAHFRMHEGRTTMGTSEHFAAITEGRFRPLDKVFADPNLPQHIREFRALAYRNTHIEVACRWLTAGQTHKALEHMYAALRVGPSPIATMARIAYSVLLSQVLNKLGWGVYLVQKASTARRWIRSRFQK